MRRYLVVLAIQTLVLAKKENPMSIGKDGVDKTSEHKVCEHCDALICPECGSNHCFTGERVHCHTGKIRDMERRIVQLEEENARLKSEKDPLYVMKQQYNAQQDALKRLRDSQTIVKQQGVNPYAKVGPM